MKYIVIESNKKINTIVKVMPNTKLKEFLENLGNKEGNYNLLHLYNAIDVISSWFEGYTGMKHKIGKIPKNKLKTYLPLVGKIFGKSIPKKVYRMSTINVKNNINKILKAKKLKCGTKIYSSFTKDKNFPKYFYNRFYKDRLVKKDKRFAYVSLELNLQKDLYIADLNSCKLFCKNVVSYCKKFKNKDMPMLFSLSKYTLKLLSSNFYKKQQEVIVKTNKSLPIKVTKILYYSGMKK